MLTQSLAILEYLEDRFPKPPLLPGDAIGRARVREICEAINAGTQPLHNVAVLRRLGDQFSIDAEGIAAWVDYWARRRLAGLEVLLARAAGRFSFGDALSLADLCLVPQVEKLREAGLQIQTYPTLARVVDELMAKPAFRDNGFETEPGDPLG